MNSVSLNLASDFKKVNTLNSQNLRNSSQPQFPKVNDSNADTVSFKSAPTKIVNNQVTKKGAKFVLGAIAGFLGIKSVKNILGTNAESQKTHLSPESKALAEALRKETVTCGRDDECEREAYSEKAIDVIVRYNEEDPAKAYDLAKILRGKTFYEPEDYEYIAQQYDANPERVNKYSAMYKLSPEVLKAANIDDAMTESLIRLPERDGKFVLQMVNKLQQEENPNLKKLALDARLHGNVEDFVKLSEVEDQEKLEDLIAMEYKHGLPIFPVSVGRVNDMLLTYLKYPAQAKYLRENGYSPKEINILAKFQQEDPVTLENIKKLGIRKATDIADSFEAYKSAPDKFKTLYEGAKNADVNAKDLSYCVTKLEEYKDFVGQLVPSSTEAYSFRSGELKNILSKIEQNPRETERILNDRRGYQFEYVLPVYKKYPDREITDRLIELETSPLAQHFNIEK